MEFHGATNVQAIKLKVQKLSNLNHQPCDKLGKAEEEADRANCFHHGDVTD